MSEKIKSGGGYFSGLSQNLLASILIGAGGSAGLYYIGPHISSKLSPEQWQLLAAIFGLSLLLLAMLLARFVRTLFTALRKWLGTARAQGDQLAIVIARLDGDDGGGITRHVEESLRRQFGRAVEIITDPETIALGEHGSRDDRELKAKERGRALLARRRGDVLIWGAALHPRDVVQLHFLARQQNEEGEAGHRYALDQTLLLPADFGAD